MVRSVAGNDGHTGRAPAPVRRAALGLVLLGLLDVAWAGAGIERVDASYRFLVSARETRGGALIRATAGELAGLELPLSFVDSAAYWGEYVCGLPGNSCAVRDEYDAGEHTLRPPLGPAGDLQTERVNVHNGANIYDAATWQIAVMLGAALPGVAAPAGADAYALAGGQNRLLAQSHDAQAAHFAIGANRAVSAGERFLYNGHPVRDPAAAYAFRMFARRWLSDDPLLDSPYAAWISTGPLPGNNPDYRAGRVSWADWKPFTGENAWAFLIGPLQAAWLHHVRGRGAPCVPFADQALQNALRVLPTFALMQAPIGGMYYAPSGTLRNQGKLYVDTREIVVENTASLYAGLRILEDTLRATEAHDAQLDARGREAIRSALALVATMIDGGQGPHGVATAGMLAFFREHAWRDGEFVQGGLYPDPPQGGAWRPGSGPRAVDANTWSVAALGAHTIDGWFGFGAAWENWQRVKRWGGYGTGDTLWGVGFSDLDGNGIGADGAYRQGVLSSEWTAGAITLVRSLRAHYGGIGPASPHHARALGYVAALARDEASMLEAVQRLRIDRYLATDFPGKPARYGELLGRGGNALPYLYASRRYAIPFGWYANPLPSTCATAWIIMLAAGFDPFVYGGTRDRAR